MQLSGGPSTSSVLLQRTQFLCHVNPILTTTLSLLIYLIQHFSALRIPNLPCSFATTRFRTKKKKVLSLYSMNFLIQARWNKTKIKTTFSNSFTLNDILGKVLDAMQSHETDTKLLEKQQHELRYR